MKRIFTVKRLFKPLMLLLVLTIATSWGLIAYHYLLKNKVEKISNKDTVEEVKEEKKEDKEVINISTDAPSEVEVKEYTVAPDMPKRVIFPTLSKSGFIQRVGIDQENKIAVPNNIYMAGWYIESVKPGEKGLSIIDGHRDGVVNKGIFYGIESLKKGSQILVEYGNGDFVYFVVKKVVTVKNKDANKTLYSKDPKIEIQLNLISCLGKFDDKTLSYDKRVIVVAARK